MGVINRAGPAPVDLTPPTLVDPTELRRRIDAAEWVVDLRNRTAFAAGHLPGQSESSAHRHRPAESDQNPCKTSTRCFAFLTLRRE
jgi:hypothetical protein